MSRKGEGQGGLECECVSGVGSRSVPQGGSGLEILQPWQAGVAVRDPRFPGSLRCRRQRGLNGAGMALESWGSDSWGSVLGTESPGQPEGLGSFRFQTPGVF